MYKLLDFGFVFYRYNEVGAEVGIGRFKRISSFHAKENEYAVS